MKNDQSEKWKNEKNGSEPLTPNCGGDGLFARRVSYCAERVWHSWADNSFKCFILLAQPKRRILSSIALGTMPIFRCRTLIGICCIVRLLVIARSLQLIFRQNPLPRCLRKAHLYGLCSTSSRHDRSRSALKKSASVVEHRLGFSGILAVAGGGEASPLLFVRVLVWQPPWPRRRRFHLSLMRPALTEFSVGAYCGLLQVVLHHVQGIREALVGDLLWNLRWQGCRRGVAPSLPGTTPPLLPSSGPLPLGVTGGAAVAHGREGKDPRLDQAYHTALWRKRTTGESSARQPFDGAEQGDLIGKKKAQKKGYEGSVPVGQNGNAVEDSNAKIVGKMEGQQTKSTRGPKKQTRTGTDCRY